MDIKLEGVATPTMIWITIITVIALIGVAILILDVVLKVREVRKPKVESELNVREVLASDNQRIKALEEADKARDAELKLLLKSQMAVMQHLLDGNNTSKLTEVRDQINDYLVYGTVVSQ